MLGGCNPQKTNLPYSYSQIARRNVVDFVFSKQMQKNKYLLIEQYGYIWICFGSSIFIENHERRVI